MKKVSGRQVASMGEVDPLRSGGRGIGRDRPGGEIVARHRSWSDVGEATYRPHRDLPRGRAGHGSAGRSQHGLGSDRRIRKVSPQRAARHAQRPGRARRSDWPRGAGSARRARRPLCAPAQPAVAAAAVLGHVESAAVRAHAGGDVGRRRRGCGVRPARGSDPHCDRPEHDARSVAPTQQSGHSFTFHHLRTPILGRRQETVSERGRAGPASSWGVPSTVTSPWWISASRVPLRSSTSSP